MRTTAYGSVLGTYVGAAMLFTYFRYAEWFDTVTRLGIPGIPFYFSYEEALIRGGLLGLFNAIGILLTFRKFSDPDKCRPAMSALLVFALFSVTAGICFLTQTHAYDPGLAIELMIPGFSAVASTWLYAGDIVLEREPPIPDKDFMLKSVELYHKETTEAIASLALVIVAGIVTIGYYHLQNLIPAQYAVQPDLVWYTVSLNVFDYGFVAIGFAVFTMAPLFIRLDILKAKLRKTQANSSIPPKEKPVH